MACDFAYRNKYRERNNLKTVQSKVNSLANMPENPFTNDNAINSDRDGAIDLARNINSNGIGEHLEEKKMNMYAIDDDD